MRQMILLLIAGFVYLFSQLTFAAPPSPEIQLQIEQGLITEPYEYTRQTEIGPLSEFMSEMLRGDLRTEYKIVVIPFQYADYPGVTELTYTDSLYFGEYFGTVRDYYLEITNGNLTLTTLDLPSEIGWLTLSGTLEDYNGSTPKNEIIELADPYVDFSQYDNDGDGVVNSVMLLHAGRGQESGGGPLMIWSHCGGFSSDLVADGVHFWRYSAVPEYSHTPRDQVIGVATHELGHQIMRWGDLYGGTASYGMRHWCLMANGTWNGSPSGILPAHPNVYYKVLNELLDEEFVSEDATNVQFLEVRTFPVIPRLWMNGMEFDEYFLVENRQRTGYDAALPSDGLLVYHIDKGEPDPTVERRSIAIVSASNQNNDNRYPYPGYDYDNRTLDSESLPNSRDYNGNDSFVALRNISDSGPVMTADIFVENPNPPSLSVIAPQAGDSWFTGDTNRILWSSSGVYYDQKIEISRDGGPWEVLTDSVENKGFLDWVTDRPVADPANIRISDAYLPGIEDISDNFAIIPPTLTITRPETGESWNVGDLEYITWSSTGMDVWETIRLETQRDAGPWEMIGDDLDNTGSYGWEVTGPVTSFGRIRITSLDDPLVTDNSPLLTIVERPLNLTSPNTFDYHALGDLLPITWELSGFTDPYVTLELSRNFDQTPATWEEIATHIRTGDQLYNWEVEGELTLHARVRIKGYTQTTVADTSYEDFIICDEHSLTVISPNGGEVWSTPDTHEIEWTSENFIASEPLKIEVSRETDHGEPIWETLADNTPNSGSWSWEITPPESQQGLIRISSIEHPEVAAVSSDNFTIGVRSLTVVEPNGNEILMVGDTVDVVWASDYFNPDSTIDVLLHRTDPEPPGHDWIMLGKAVRIGQSLTWIVEEPTATDGLVVIMSNTYREITDTSDAYFYIGEPNLQVTSPNGGEDWFFGQEQEITWETDINDAYVTIEIDRYYPSGEWEVLEEFAENSGTYLWTVEGPASEHARIRVLSTLMSDFADTSDASFSIASHDLQVLTPEGGELWWIGETYDIVWSSLNFTAEDSLRVDIYRGRGSFLWEEVAVVPILDAVYPWTVTGWYSSVVKVRLTSISYPQIADTSEDFTTNFPVLTLTAPNGGETLTIGDVFRIEWTQNYELEDTVSLGLSRNHPYGEWETIIENIPNAGYYDWTITGPPADSARIEIFSTVMYWPKDISDTIFVIESTIHVLEPNERTLWRVGETVDIVWDGDIPSGQFPPENVRIELCRSSSFGQTPDWELIDGHAPHTGRYSWFVTGPDSRTTLLRISKAARLEDFALSDGTFDIIELHGIFRIDNPMKEDPEAVVLRYTPIVPPRELKSLTFNGVDELPENTRITLARSLHEDGTIECIYDHVISVERSPLQNSCMPLYGEHDEVVRIDKSEFFIIVSRAASGTERRSGGSERGGSMPLPENIDVLSVFTGNTETVIQLSGNDVELNWNTNGSTHFNVYRSRSSDDPGVLIGTVTGSHFTDRDAIRQPDRAGFYYVIPQALTISPAERLDAITREYDRNH